MKYKLEKFLFFKLYRSTRSSFVRKVVMFYMSRFGDATLYLTIDPKNERRLLKALND